MWDKFKLLLADDAVFYSLLLVLVAGASFGLGRYSAVEAPLAPVHPQITLSQVPVSAAAAITADPREPALSSSTAHAYVASKTGSKYHLPSCPGASQIKEENKIYFASKEEAQRAGYAPAANCKGI
jgi:hypothetical protein